MTGGDECCFSTCPTGVHAVACAGSVVLTQTHPAAPYVCRTGNITIRCQYDGLEGVLNVLWNVDNMTNLDLVTKTLPGHTALERTESHQDVVIASFAALRGTYDCAVVYSANITSSPNLSPGPIEGEYHSFSSNCFTDWCGTSYVSLMYSLYVWKPCELFRWRHCPLCPDLGKQDSHHFECHLVSRLPQVLLLHCVSLHPRWLHQCHPTCPQWHLPHSDLPPTRHHLQDWGGGCEEGRQSRRTEGKGHRELFYWRRWGVSIYMYS